VPRKHERTWSGDMPRICEGKPSMRRSSCNVEQPNTRQRYRTSIRRQATWNSCLSRTPTQLLACQSVVQTETSHVSSSLVAKHHQRHQTVAQELGGVWDERHHAPTYPRAACGPGLRLYQRLRRRSCRMTALSCRPLRTQCPVMWRHGPARGTMPVRGKPTNWSAQWVMAPFA
jgi:hypothetical protein